MNTQTTSMQVATATPAWRPLILPVAILWAVLSMFLHAANVTAQPVCNPILTVKQVRFSEMMEMKRFWTATLDVDASRCTTTSGQFAIRFVRLAENAPDVDFVERFTWRTGRMDLVVEFWADESVLEYWIEGMAACPCRSG